MESKEAERNRLAKRATIQRIAFAAQEKNWYIPQIQAVQQEEIIAKRLRNQALLRQRRLPRITKSGKSLAATKSHPAIYKDDIKEDMLTRDTEYGGITDIEIFKRSSRRPHASINDTDILQRIVVRENLLIEIADTVKSRAKTMEASGLSADDANSILADYGDMVSLFSALRHCTVDVVEYIRCWRSVQPSSSSTSKPFLFRGMNYLLKIATDLDYLDQYEDLVQYFGFCFSNNPLIYLGGGTLTDPTNPSDSSDISGYFHMQLSVGGLVLARLRSCEREICREKEMLLREEEERRQQQQQEQQRRYRAIYFGDDEAASPVASKSTDHAGLTGHGETDLDCRIRFKVEK
jgi:hypothetical protein